jgi:plasmid replication initiation protein
MKTGKEECKMNDRNLVTKANALVMAHHNMSLEELRVVLTLISVVQLNDEDFKPYEFKIADFLKLLGVDDSTKYINIPKITKELMRRILEIKEGKTLLQVAWLSSAKHDAGSGTVTLKFDPELKPYLLGLKELFTTYRLEHILKLTSKYSIRLYELMKCNEYRKTFTVSLDELTEIFKLSQGYSDYAQIKRRVLEPAKKEVNEKTDIVFSYEPITERKKVIALKFHIQANPENKLKKTLPELPERQELPALPDTTSSSQTDIGDIKAEFRRLYGGELMDRFIKTMLAEKGLEHIWECLRTYQNYIEGRNIRNIAGDFFRFVTDGYQKPTAYKGNIPQRDNFEQREYDDEELEKYYADLTPEKDCSDKSKSGNSRITEVGENNLKSIKQILTPG